MKASRGLACAIFCALFAGCVSPAQPYNSRGVALFNRGQYEAARSEFLEATAVDPVNADGFYNLGSTYHKLGDAGEAEQNYFHCLALNPDHTKANHAFVVLLLEQERTNAAYDLVQDWMARSPGSPDPLVEMAWLERQAGKTESARQTLHQALAIEPRHSRALTELASIYEGSKDSERALALYQRALVANPSHPDLSTKVADLRDAVPTQDTGRAIAQNNSSDRPTSQRQSRDLRYQLR